MNAGKLAESEDHVNLKCWDQKRRYGVNFLYPVQRYVNALSLPRIDPSRVDLAPADEASGVDNPLFADLSGGGAPQRDPRRVFFLGIVGVPWQAIARRDSGGAPDLAAGFRSFAELEDDLDYLIGDPDRSIPPGDPFMIESGSVRNGTSQITGESPGGPNGINGNDYLIEAPVNDLQYACIFPLSQSVADGPDCDDCVGPSCNNPLCDGTTQVAAKAYPGRRALAVMRGLGSQAAFSSICPAEIEDAGSPLFAYRPAVGALMESMRSSSGTCLADPLPQDSFGVVRCAIIEATNSDSCSCDEGAGRLAVEATTGDGAPNPAYDGVLQAQADGAGNCFCMVQSLEGDARQQCQFNVDPQAVEQGSGWCYIDATTEPPIGDPALAASCPAANKRTARFVGAASDATDSALYLVCEK